jgi:hypothetical protein
MKYLNVASLNYITALVKMPNPPFHMLDHFIITQLTVYSCVVFLESSERNCSCKDPNLLGSQFLHREKPYLEIGLHK